MMYGASGGSHGVAAAFSTQDPAEPDRGSQTQTASAWVVFAASETSDLHGDGHFLPNAPESHRMSRSTGTKEPPTMPPMQPAPQPPECDPSLSRTTPSSSTTGAVVISSMVTEVLSPASVNALFRAASRFDELARTPPEPVSVSIAVSAAGLSTSRIS